MAQVAQQTGTTSAPPGGGQELPIEGKTIKALTLLSLKRTFDMFVGNHGQKLGLDEDSQKLKIACKVGFQTNSILCWSLFEFDDIWSFAQHADVPKVARLGLAEGRMGLLAFVIQLPSSGAAGCAPCKPSI